jgi:hypothetical protein
MALIHKRFDLYLKKPNMTKLRECTPKSIFAKAIQTKYG